jgi:hypothetical protein
VSVDQAPAALLAALQVAVPMHIDELRGHTADQLVVVVHRCVDVVASEGDNILFQGAKRGDSARAFNAFARGLAVLAYAPGGVEFAGLRWDVPAGESPLHPDDIVDQLVDLARLTAPIVTVPATGGRL